MTEAVNVLLNQLSIQTGTIVGFEPEGTILVSTTPDDQPVRSYFLRTTDAPPPALASGDRVLVAIDADDACGYVLGSITPYAAPVAKSSGTNGESQVHVEAQHGAAHTCERFLQPNGSDTVSLKARKIHIEAGDELQLTCGEGTILIDRRGKVVVRGTDVVSRARRNNKVRGASVAIN